MLAIYLIPKRQITNRIRVFIRWDCYILEVIKTAFIYEDICVIGSPTIIYEDNVACVAQM
jgi:hypothetical protein